MSVVRKTAVCCATFAVFAVAPSLGVAQQPVSPAVASPAKQITLASTGTLRAGIVQASLQDGSQQPSTLTPLPESEFDSRVRAADISMDGLGTGIIPKIGHLPGGQVGLPDGVSRGATYQCMHWAPSSIQHYPLYFEDAMLERHGQDRWGRLQPLASGVKFFSTLSLVPYIATLQRPLECRYVLGQYRPGTCAPVLRDGLPYDYRAVSVEAASVASFFWAAPL